MGLFSGVTNTVKRVASNPIKAAINPFTALGGNGTVSTLGNLTGMGTFTGLPGGLGGGNMFGNLTGGGGSKMPSFDYSGAPVRPPYESMIDPSTGLLKQPYQIQGNINTQGQEALRNEALRTGPSAWRTLSEQQDADKLAARQQSGLAQARSALAQTRGLSTGAAERLAGRSAVEGLRERQGLAGQYALADEAKRMDTLAALPGQELNLANFNRQTQGMNVQGALADINAKRQADMDAYLKNMEVWGGMKTAAAIPSGNGGGLFGSFLGGSGGGGIFGNLFG